MSTFDYETFRNQDTTGDILAEAWAADAATPLTEPRSHREPRGRLKHAGRVLSVITVAGALVSSTAFIATYDTHDDARYAVHATADTTLDAYERSVADARRARAANSASREALRQRAPRGAVRSLEIKPRSPTYVQPVSVAQITSCYGSRWGSFHKGIDFAAPSGTPIHAAQGGVVIQAGWRFSGMGNSVAVRHQDGSIALYAHASQVLVRTNQRVAAGARIALVGSTGYATGPHLHLAVASAGDLGTMWNSLINPAPWLRQRGLATGHCT
jgi:murein DD-endopeptidase MepM/ murein hydrolase activator NlpD